MIADLLILVLSLFFLIRSADALIEEVVAIGKRMHISTMVLGLTVVAVGTSLPEVMASAAAAFEGYPGIALGNVVGSNICNIALMLSLPALFIPIRCKRELILAEGLLMIGLTFLLWMLVLFNGGLGRPAAVLFLLGFVGYLYRLFRTSGSAGAIADEGSEDETPGASPFWLTTGKLVLAFAVLIVSSEFLVGATVSLAQGLGISESVIALSLIAIGTSLPELTVSFAAAKKNQGDILIGNIVGSNIANILLVLGLSTLIRPFEVTTTALLFDFPMMLGLAVLAVYFLADPQGITKRRAQVLLALYGAVIVRVVLWPGS